MEYDISTKSYDNDISTNDIQRYSTTIFQLSPMTHAKALSHILFNNFLKTHTPWRPAKFILL